jgi:hypothetical protein
MATIDAFAADAFSTVSLTAAVNRMPYVPKLTQLLNIFQEVSIRTDVAQVEENLGKLALVSTAARGSTKDVRQAPRRRKINFDVPHIPYFQTIMADDIKDIVAFGSETELTQLSRYVNDQQEGMKKDIEATQEWHRLGAIKGLILDADNSSTVHDLYAAFGITQTEVDWTFNAGTPVANAVPTLCNAVIRAVGDAMGNASYGQIFALCGDSYFDSLRFDPDVKQAYDRWRNGEFLRMSQLGSEWYSVAANGFEYNNIYFLNYRGQIGDVPFVASTEAYFTPSNVPGMYQEILAPADMIEWANTPGQRFYTSQERLPHGKGIELHEQSNFLAMNTTPGASIKSTVTIV